MSNEKIAIDFDELEATTEKAWCISIDGDKHWIPKSMCSVYVGKKKAHMPEWLAIDKGLV